MFLQVKHWEDFPNVTYTFDYTQRSIRLYANQSYDLLKILWISQWIETWMSNLENPLCNNMLLLLKKFSFNYILGKLFYFINTFLHVKHCEDFPIVTFTFDYTQRYIRLYANQSYGQRKIWWISAGKHKWHICQILSRLDHQQRIFMI